VRQHEEDLSLREEAAAVERAGFRAQRVVVLGRAT
jgi:hypothetical protein